MLTYSEPPPHFYYGISALDSDNDSNDKDDKVLLKDDYDYGKRISLPSLATCYQGFHFLNIEMPAKCRKVRLTHCS